LSYLDDVARLEAEATLDRPVAVLIVFPTHMLCFGFDTAPAAIAWAEECVEQLNRLHIALNPLTDPGDAVFYEILPIQDPNDFHPVTP